MNHAAGLFLAVALGLPCHAQIIRDSMQAVGGGGRSVLIPTDAALAAEKARLEKPPGMTPKMIWVTPGKVLARHKKDGKITLELSYTKSTDGTKEAGTYLVADHPDAPYLAVNEQAKCIIVLGPISDEFEGRRLYYFFDKKEVSDRIKIQFSARHPDAPLD